jgi:aldehyde dehydrogenase (NAD+)/betaine-aldehyde dehydrogenase
VNAPATLDGLSAGARELVAGPAVLIDGVWEEAEGEDESISLNPTTGEILATVRFASLEQVERAIGAARRGFDGGWSRENPATRSALLRRIADAVDAHRGELIELVVTEAGAPLRLARSMQVGMPVANLEWAAEMALKGPRGGYEEALLPHFGTPPSMSMLRREPVGVIAGITGYNFPINSAVWKLGPGLAAGCSFVLKPSPRTPLASIALARLAQDADIPPGVLTFVLGGPDVGTLLASHRDVDMVMFTGSLNVGRKIMVSAAETTKRLVLELGGKSASIVLPGAQVDEVVEGTILRWCRMAGQACGATTRTLVPRAEYERFVDASRAVVARIPVGDPRDEATEVGPLIRDEHRSFVEGHIEAAVERGATIEAGGGRPSGFEAGFFMNPTVVGGLTNADVLCREELFGPVGALLPYDSVDEAVAIANDSDYGLHAAVFGPSVEAIEIARRLRTGSVAVNGGGFMRPEGPWGGYKQSGFGREMGEDGFQELFQVKHIQWPLR